jgi:hypothetical protein
MTHFRPLPPYSTHIRSATQVLDLSLGVSICQVQIPFHSLTHAASKLFPPAHLTAGALVPDSSLVTHLQEPSSDENDSLETSFSSDGVDVQYILPDMSLGRKDRQRFLESRLRKLVLTFIYCPRIIIKSFLAGRSRDFKRASCSARSQSLKFASHLQDRVGEHSGAGSELDVSTSSYDR